MKPNRLISEQFGAGARKPSRMGLNRLISNNFEPEPGNCPEWRPYRGRAILRGVRFMPLGKAK